MPMSCPYDLSLYHAPKPCHHIMSQCYVTMSCLNVMSYCDLYLQPQEGAEDDATAGVEDLKRVLASGVKGKPYSRYVYVSPPHRLP